MENLISKLKALHSVMPDPDYSLRSKTTILHEHPIVEMRPARRMFFTQIKKQFVALAFSSALVILSGIFGASYLKEVLVKSSSIAKANRINSVIQIKLNEIKYFIESGAPIDATFVAETDDLLLEAKRELEAAAASLKEDDIKAFMEKILISQELILKMKSEMGEKK